MQIILFNFTAQLKGLVAIPYYLVTLLTLEILKIIYNK